MIRRIAAALPLCGLLCFARCGDGSFIFVSTFGIAVGDIDCNSGDGSFHFRDSEGLTLLVIIGDDTNIVFASGGSGACEDIRDNRTLQVSGGRTNDTIHAETIRLQDG